MNHSFQNFISNYGPISNEDWQKIYSCLERKVIQPNELILSEGRICRHVYFLESGFLRYFVWKDGNDISKFFTTPPYCFTSQRSFTQEIPSNENIEALEESVIWKMSREDAYRLFEMKSWSTFVRNLVQEVQFFTEEILVDIQNKTAKERYREMLTNGHIFLEKVPLKHLASFLGIAPQSLSRIRKKLSLERI